MQRTEPCPSSAPLPSTPVQAPPQGRPCRYSSDFIASCDPSEADEAEARRGRVIDEDGPFYFVVWGDDSGSQVEPLQVFKTLIDLDLQVDAGSPVPSRRSPIAAAFLLPRGGKLCPRARPGLPPPGPPVAHPRVFSGSAPPVSSPRRPPASLARPSPAFGKPHRGGSLPTYPQAPPGPLARPRAPAGHPLGPRASPVRGSLCSSSGEAPGRLGCPWALFRTGRGWGAARGRRGILGERVLGVGHFAPSFSGSRTPGNGLRGGPWGAGASPDPFPFLDPIRGAARVVSVGEAPGSANADR